MNRNYLNGYWLRKNIDEFRELVAQSVELQEFVQEASALIPYILTLKQLLANACVDEERNGSPSFCITSFYTLRLHPVFVMKSIETRPASGRR
jgi:hypothetical protein